MAVTKVETEIIATIAVRPIGQAGILVIMYVEIFKTNITVFTCNVIL
jgi:hypothetical protein